MLVLAAALVACKAVYAPAEARGCPGLETDLILVDGRFMIAHGPEIPADALPLERYVEGLPKLKMMNLDFKDKFTSLSAALEAQRPALEKLAAKTEVVVYSSPVPARYAELRSFLARDARLGELGYELADYTAQKSASWGLPLKWWQRLFLPPFRLFSSLYARWKAPPWLIMQESTAASWTRPGRVMCWTRDPITGPPPERCLWTQRHREPGTRASK